VYFFSWNIIFGFTPNVLFSCFFSPNYVQFGGGGEKTNSAGSALTNVGHQSAFRIPCPH